MRVVFLEDVAGVAQGGDVKEVKNGFGRNYLLPQRLATLATREALQRIERLKRQAEVKRLQTLTDMKALSEELDGAQIDVEMRAGASGRLYGSVTNATVADEIGKLTGREIDRRTVEISEPLRQVGLHTVSVRLHSDVIAGVNVLVYPIGSEPEEFLASWTAQQEQAVEESEDGSTETAAQAEDAGGEPEAVAAEEAGGESDAVVAEEAGGESDAVVAEEADGGSTEGD